MKRPRARRRLPRWRPRYGHTAITVWSAACVPRRGTLFAGHWVDGAAETVHGRDAAPRQFLLAWLQTPRRWRAAHGSQPQRHNGPKTMGAKVIAILRGATAFLQWLFSAEHLSAAPTDTLGESSRRRGFAAWLFADDRLAEASCGPSAARRRNWLRWVLSPGQLPTAPDKPRVLAAGHHFFWGWLLGGEDLRECISECVLTPPHPALSLSVREEFSDAPLGEKLGAPRAGFFRWLLSPDVCPHFEESPRRRSGGFWYWALSSETCPCVKEPSCPPPKGFWYGVVSSERL